MPYHVDKSTSCPMDKPWAVMKNADGKIMSCHPSKEMANKQIEALYANEAQMSATVQTEYLRAGVASGKPVGVDRENKIIHGYVVAQLGSFKTGRGRFAEDSLKAIVDLINGEPDGLLANYGHQLDTGSSDALDAFLGRSKSARIDGDKVRADLHFNPTAFQSHNGGVSRGERLMLRAETDPKSFASSLVLAAKKTPGGSGPPHWLPLAIQSSDIVLIGDAVHGGALAADDEAEQDEARIRLRNMKRKALTTGQPLT